MANLLYPGNSSYHRETGGKLKNLRESTTIEKVRAYHKKYYRPENLVLTITGQISQEELFKALEKTEQKVIAKREADGNVDVLEKPFQRPLDQVKEDLEKTVEFPSEDEQFGWVLMGWRVPGKLTDNAMKITAMTILTNYLTSTSVAPLTKTFVDIEEPLATNIDMDYYANWEPAITADFLNVPVRRMDEIEPLFKKVIKEIIDKGADGFNIKRIHTIRKYCSVANLFTNDAFTPGKKKKGKNH